MSEHETEKTELSEEELDGEEAEELPARQTMMILEPDPGVFPLPADVEPVSGPGSEVPDDRYEQ